jgi:NADPH:quinone reductase-like Zn-dependent oxidoreductase/NAD(P)-dependent dehydrogenase (short-subunit alcohol dehydrogenase family)/acyl carrier protein
MAVVELSMAEVQERLAGFEDRLSVAVSNSPRSTVLSGAPEALDELLSRLEADGVFCRRIKVDVASHSPQMDPLRDDLLAALKEVRPQSGRTSIHSAVTTQVTDGAGYDAAYWVRNLREPVQFGAVIAQQVEADHTLLVELSPHPILLPTMETMLAGRCRAWGSLRREQPEQALMLETLGALWTAGYPLDWSRLYPVGRVVASAPTYPFQRERYWMDLPKAAGRARRNTGHPLLGEKILLAEPGGTLLWYAEVEGLSPAACLEMAMVAGQEAFGGGAFTIQDMAFRDALRMGPVQMTCTPDSLGEATFRISGREPDGSWTWHARGRLLRSGDVSAEPTTSLEGLTQVHVPAEVASQMALYQVHPALLEACLEGTSLTGVRTVRRYRPPTAEAWSHRQGSDLRVFNADGQVVLDLLGLQLETRPDATGKSPDEALFLSQVWERADLGTPPAPPAKAGAWLVLQDGGGVGEALAAGLQAQGETVVVLSADAWKSTDPRAFDVALQQMAATGRPGRGVVHLWSLDTRDTADLEAAAMRGCGSAVHLVQALSRTGWRDMPRLWLVTRRSQAVSGPDRALAIAQAPLWGLARSLSMEHAELQPTRIDLGMDGDVDRLLAEVRAGGMEEEVAFRTEGRYVARLVRGAPPELTTGEVREPAGGRPFRVDVDRPGALEHLTLRATEARPPGSGEVSIAVEAAGVNFKDVLIALGTVPLAPLGAECVGRVLAAGEGVEGLAVGQLVMALAVGSLASRVTVPALLVRPVPAQWSPVEAATFSVAHVTAWHALHHAARLETGERVLIHAATGGVGQAALQWARHVGADIYATAGSAEKRAWLHAQGVQHVSDSRSLQFVDDVLAWTHGEGVDVVLNSLSGTLADKSLTLLRDGGRFVELGQHGCFVNRHSLSCSRVDLTAVIQKRPHQVRAWWDEVASWAEQGVLKPLSHRTVPVAQVTGAFRTMAQGGHPGKLVVTFDDPEVVVAVPRAPSAQVIRPDGTYLVTGGLGGLGLELSRWLVAQGARHLLLLSRRGATGEAAQAVSAMQAAGVQVVVAQVDVADRVRLAQALATLPDQMPPVRGVAHTAGVLDDGMAVQLTLERLHAVMAPKVSGAWNLHELTLGAPLDFFVLYSSLASLMGSPGQVNYGAGNAFLDALAHLRQAQGRPGLSINWGAFSEVGLVVAQENRSQRMAGRGIGSMTPAEGLGVLSRLLGTPVAQVGVALLNPRQWVGFFPSMAGSLRLSRLHAEGPLDPDGAPALHELLSQALPAERTALLEQFIREQVGQTLRLDAERVESLTPFKDLGIDSLMALEIRNRLEAGLGMRLSGTLLFTYSHLASLARYLLGQFDHVTTPPTLPGGDETELASVQRLTQAEKLAMIELALAETGE